MNTGMLQKIRHNHYYNKNALLKFICRDNFKTDDIIWKKIWKANTFECYQITENEQCVYITKSQALCVHLMQFW